MEFYDRDGNPIDLDMFSRLNNDPDYKRVQQDDVLTPDGRMFYVSTVWLGMNHAVFSRKPMIFETMVFERGLTDEYCQRYTSELAATCGHQDLVDQLHRGVPITELSLASSLRTGHGRRGWRNGRSE